MAMQDTFISMARREQPGRPLRLLVLALGGASMLALLTLNWIIASDCVSAGGKLQFGGYGLDCLMDLQGTVGVPAMIAIAG